MIKGDGGKEHVFGYYADSLTLARDHAETLAWDVKQIAPASFRKPEVAAYRSTGGRWRPLA